MDSNAKESERKLEKFHTVQIHDSAYVNINLVNRLRTGWEVRIAFWNKLKRNAKLKSEY